jgi:hypothetical protein
MIIALCKEVDLAFTWMPEMWPVNSSVILDKSLHLSEIALSIFQSDGEKKGNK